MGEKATCGKSTQELLLEFQQTGSQAPFEEIARRYAGMVYNVALQVTRDAHDAEDATQATFLTLAVHAKTAGKIRYVGPWLRKVSQRLALDIRRSKKRRTNREQRHAVTRAASNGNGDGTVSRHDLTIANSLQLEELRDILRGELDKLPAKYRMPLILYYFGGLTPDQIGKELRCKTSTLGVRLHRGRKMLADSLSSRGININSAVVGAVLAAMVDSSIRDNLVHSCTHAAVHVAANGFVADATVSAPVMAMMHSVNRIIRLSQLKGIVAAVVVVVASLCGTVHALRQLDVLSPQMLQKLNPLNLIRPLLQRMLQPPTLMLQTPPSATEGYLPLVSREEYPFTPAPWQPAMGGTWTGQPYIVTGQLTHVGSERLLASQFEAALSTTPIYGVATTQDPIVIAPLPVTAVLPQSIADSTPPGAATIISPASTAAPVAMHSPAPATAAHAYDVLVVDRAVVVSSDQPSDPAVFTFASGTLRARKIVVGDSTNGTVVQTGGHIVAEEAVVVGNQPGSQGTIQFSGTGTLTTPTLIVGAGGAGTFIQSGGVVSANTGTLTGQVVLGEQTGSTGNYTITDGTLLTDDLIIGKSGSGSFTQVGGEVIVHTAQLGTAADGAGTLSITGGSVQVGAGSGLVVAGVRNTSVRPVPSTQDPLLVIGGQGAGTIVLRSNTTDAPITEEPGSTATTVSAGRSGTIRGYGRVEVTGPLISNGRVIADGFGARNVLDLSSAAVIINAVDNPTVNGYNGWFARNGGSLKLPLVKVAGVAEYTWGEYRFDRELDLVNSVRFTPHTNVLGDVDLILLDPLDPNVPRLDGVHHGLSLWELSSAIEFSGIDLLVRYDDFLVSVWREQETELVLWAFENGAWEPLSGEMAGIDIEKNLIWGTAMNPEYFAVGLLPDNLAGMTAVRPVAVGVPEPMAVSTLAIAGAAMLLRRRRR